MKHSTLSFLLASALFLPQVAGALDPPKPEPTTKPAPGTPTAPREITWEDLLPESERNAPPMLSQRMQPLFDDESGPAASQEGSSQVNKALDRQTVKLPGFLVPLNRGRDAQVSEFLLVPYFGACIHVPPPPPNQIVHVKMAQPIRMPSMFHPVWITGQMRTQRVTSDLADAAYTVAAVKIEKYEEEP